MNSRFYYPLNTGSLGEPRRPRSALYATEQRAPVHVEVASVSGEAEEPSEACPHATVGALYKSESTTERLNFVGEVAS